MLREVDVETLFVTIEHRCLGPEPHHVGDRPVTRDHAPRPHRGIVVVLPNSEGQSVHDDATVVFLAGSIDEGRAEKWQDQVVDALAALDVVALNPRREDWNADLRQDIDEPEFVRQVDWELDGIERADVVLFHFSPAGPAPISLLELGKTTGLGKRIVVSCPEGYWRRGNVQVVCRRAGVPTHASLQDAIDELIPLLGSVTRQKGSRP
jgi:hypothetical protein